MPVDPQRVQAVFLLAIEQAERAAVLDRECGTDAEMRLRVEALLIAHDEPGSLLARPAVAPEQTVDEIPRKSDPRPAADVGSIVADRYKLLEQIGEGGMGTVWVAEQTQPVRRKVALKLIKAGMDSKTVLTRFEAERQALAMMDHPNIAKILDGGTTESGRPFFVMEYVKGIPFTKYCDDARLSIADRLSLFVPVCQAVQHAHQKGIIHRDLKPSNVLVCLYDGKPVPKVIDFGLAKAMYQPLTDHTLYTAHGVMMGTPLYMSPEQAEMNNLDVDTRSDIYALGVILYELLTGTTPLEAQRFREAAWHEMLRLIKEEEPPRPSARLSGSGSLPSLAAQRQLDPVKLTKLVRGELDWIVMKCLEKDRSRRYDTATGLARDVERYLADEAVEACPPSMSYRMRKFARKHRAALATAAMIVLLLVAAVALSTWQASLTRLERDRAIEAEREARTLQTKAQEDQQKAVKSAAEATAMCEFFKELTSESRRTIFKDGKGRAKTVDEAMAILDSERVRVLFADQPLAEAEIRDWVGSQACYLDYSIGSDINSITFATVVTLPGFPPRKEAVDQLRHLERALELRRVHLAPDHPKTLATMHKVGLVLRSQSHDHKALVLFGELVARSNAALGPSHPDTIEYKNSLASAYESAGRLEDAVFLLADSYSLAREKWGKDSYESLHCSNSLAAAYEKAGRIKEALRQREESLRCKRKLAAGSNDFSGLGDLLREVARLYDQMQDYTRAEPLWREAVPFFKDNENDLVVVQESLGRCLLHRGKSADSLRVLRDCLAIREKKNPDDWTTFNTKSMLGGALLGRKKYADAEPLLMAGCEGMKKRHKTIPPQGMVRLTEAVERLVQLYDAWGKKEKADEWRKELVTRKTQSPAK